MTQPTLICRLLLLTLTFAAIGCGGEPLETGCTYLKACNYDSRAVLDDGSCDFESCQDEEDTGDYVNWDLVADCVVSPIKMNVLYRGVPNPIEVSVPGVPQDKIDVRIDGGHSIKRQSDGIYVVEPNASSSVREAKITVSAELPDGSKKTLDAKNFRVKRIPDPVAFWTGKKSSDKGISKAEILSFSPVAARMEGFDFDVQVRVKSFTMRISKDGSFSALPSPNNRITPDQQEELRRVRRGNILYLDDILVSMPDGTERNLPAMKLKVTG